MKEPMTVECIIIEERGLKYCLMPTGTGSENVQQGFQQVPIAPRYIARVVGGPLDGHEISIKKLDKSSRIIELKPKQKITIQREPHHGFFYNDYLKGQDGTFKGINIEWL